MPNIEVIDIFVPKNTGDFPIVEDLHLLGGWRAINTLTSRDAIPSQRRKEGMIVYVLATDTAYQLIGGISNVDWAALDPGRSIKSGKLIPADFSGFPKKGTVAFTSPYLTTGYAIAAIALTDGTKTFAPVIESKTASGFVVNIGSNNVANLVEVGWHTVLLGG
jgi:hypothetical protein